ncbi:hypothetical protein AB0368_03935 [Actinoplanes sp. NPDC051475]|uniref:hypothetical protein n=1 Tax=Actinoplanes sp. NPDC051475 TaxID=3157225 RepID=UPI00344EBE7A
MPRTNEYSETTASILKEIEIRDELSSHYRRASKAAFVAFYHYDKHQAPLVFQTPIEVSGQASTRGTRASQLPHPQNELASREAESAAAQSHFTTLQNLKENNWQELRLTGPLPPPYRVSQRVVGDKGACDKCEDTSIYLANYAQRLWPGNQQGDPDMEQIAGSMSSVYLRDGAHAEQSTMPGRFRDHVARSQYGSPSAIPTVTGGTPTWRNDLYGDEPSTRNQTAPGYSSSSLPPIADNDPYTSTEYSSSSRRGSDRTGSPGSGSDGTGVSSWSDEAGSPTNYLPAGSTARVSHPNKHIPETRAEQPSGPQFSQDRAWAWHGDKTYALEARVTSPERVSHIYRSVDSSHSALAAQFRSDGSLRDFRTQNAKAEKLCGDAARAGHTVESYSDRVYGGYGTGDHRKKHHSGHKQKRGGPTA